MMFPSPGHGPPNTQMEPTRPWSCAIVLLRCAAHLQR
jgi:hypothetical protein